MLGYSHPGPQGNRAPEPARPVVVVCPQLCPQVVNPSRLLWKQPARDAPGQCPDRVLAGQSPIAGEVAWVTDLVVRGILGVAGNLGSQERNKRWTPAARRHPQAGRAAPGAGLTLWIASAYRCSVTGCRPVPHVHGSSNVRGWAVPADQAETGPRKSCTADPPVVAAPDTPWREAREQAYVPAEQPSSSQGARFPSAHAHPRRPVHPVVAPPQGPQEPGRLTAAAPRSAATPCCPRRTDSPTQRRSGGPCAAVVARGPAPSSSTWPCRRSMRRGPRLPRRRLGWASW
jgi:hypothetical protein